VTRAKGKIVVGALVGYVASRLMDQATTWFYAQQSDESKRREEEIAPGGTLVQFGKQLGQALGRELDDDEAAKVGLAFHRTMGVTYGMITAALVQRGMRPMAAGLAVGTAAFVLVDEGTTISDFAAYPVESHMRGVVGHAALGLVAGALMSLIESR
jgi:hypothetical protein